MSQYRRSTSRTPNPAPLSLTSNLSRDDLSLHTPKKIKNFNPESFKTNDFYSDDENSSPDVAYRNEKRKKHVQFPTNNTATPLTPAKTLINQLKQRLEVRKSVDILTTPDRITSPGLESLRNTPASQGLKIKRRILEVKHLQAKSNVPLVNGVGGGISLWPHMDNMRLDLQEAFALAITSCCLLVVTVITFFSFHGQVMEDLERYGLVFPNYSRPLPLLAKRENFVESLLVWHVDFKGLVDRIEERFSLVGIDVGYVSSGLVYVAGMSSLLYLLTENIFSKNPLTPRRIKIWVSLVVVLGAWTVLTLYLFIAAYRLEMALRGVLQVLQDQLGNLVLVQDLDLSTYHDVCRYWSTRCLPPRGSGILVLFGLVSILDVAYYLGYYCVPVATALLTPVVHLVMSLVQVYAPSNASS